MRRVDRLMVLVDRMRRAEEPLRFTDLRKEMKVAKITLERDLAVLQASGIPVSGTIEDGYMLGEFSEPEPIQFDIREVAALTIALDLLLDSSEDDAVIDAAHSAIAKIAAATSFRAAAEESGDAGDADESDTEAEPEVALHRLGPVDEVLIRGAAERHRKIEITYEDAEGERTRRRVWPLAIATSKHATSIAAWCELRRDFRHFRFDRIANWVPLDERYDPEGGRVLERYLRSLRDEAWSRRGGFG